MRDFARSDDARVSRQLDRLAALSLPQGRLSLAPIREILSRLGDPQLRLPPVFHIAGTNGKGSTAAFLTAMLEAGGKTVHKYTSPHLVRYNERIRIAGRLIDDAMLADVLSEVIDASEDIGASFFEVTTAAAFLAFARTPADACVLEVGLGGRFDATNVIETAAICAIASLGIDHEAFLLAPEDGVPTDPAARIAFEKAGIIKPGVPVVTQAYPDGERREIVRAASVAGAPLHMRGDDWDAALGTALDYRDGHGALVLPPPGLPGMHQADNAALAVAMLRHQDHVTVGDDAMAAGMTDARWPARMQRLSDGPLAEILPGATLWLDGGHNLDAARAIAAFLKERDRPCIAIMGMLANKDARGFIAVLAPHLSGMASVPIPGHEHHDPAQLSELARTHGIAARHGAPTVEAALRAIAKDRRSGDPYTGDLLICGSLYLAGEVLRANGTVPD